jgi:hypothetical protein
VQSILVSAASHHNAVRVDWGDAPTWINIVVTAIALCAAIRGARTAQKVYEIESQRDEVAADERRARSGAERRTQADKVAAWCTQWEVPLTPSGQQFEYGAIIKNASDLPIYDITVEFCYIRQTAGGVSSRRSAYPIPVIPPQETERAGADELMGRSTDQLGHVNYAVAIEFRDTAGIRWRRDIHGKLAERGHTEESHGSE